METEFEVRIESKYIKVEAYAEECYGYEVSVWEVIYEDEDEWGENPEETLLKQPRWFIGKQANAQNGNQYFIFEKEVWAAHPSPNLCVIGISSDKLSNPICGSETFDDYEEAEECIEKYIECIKGNNSILHLR